MRTPKQGQMRATPAILKSIDDYVEQIKQRVKKGDEYFKSAGILLRELKVIWTDNPDLSSNTWRQFVQEKIGLGKSRTYQLLAIADGRTTEEKEKAKTAARVAKSKAKLKAAAASPDGVGAAPVAAT